MHQRATMSSLTYCRDRRPVPTVQNSIPSRFVSTFKRFCNKEYGENIWQYRSYDHIIRNREDYEEHLRYIYENPVRWYYDELYTECKDEIDEKEW